MSLARRAFVSAKMLCTSGRISLWLGGRMIEKATHRRWEQNYERDMLAVPLEDGELW